jgi:hypothetical protein
MINEAPSDCWDLMTGDCRPGFASLQLAGWRFALFSGKLPDSVKMTPL